MRKVDIVLGLDHGDEGKGKVTNALLRGKSYDWVCRATGGPNADHTAWMNEKEYTLHQIPAGVFYGKKLLIGGGCAVNIERLFREMEELQEFQPKRNLHVAYNAHVIQPEHIREDCEKDPIGSTKQGIMPVFRDKYAKIGHRAEEYSELKDFLCDPSEVLEGNILVEGSQGFNLCPDWGDYPFVTSVPCTSAYVMHSLGLPPRDIGTVYGVAKTYSTYIGTKPFQPVGSVFERLQELGQEFGYELREGTKELFKRKRFCNWLNLDLIIRACHINGASNLVVNKLDVLRALGEWRFYYHGGLLDLLDEEHFRQKLAYYVQRDLGYLNITFSASPTAI